MAEDAQYAYDFLLLAPNQPNIIATYSQTNRSSSARTGWVGVVEPGQLRHCDVLFNRAFDTSANDYIFRTYFNMQEVKLIAHRRLLICRLLSRAIEHSHDGNNTLIDRVFSVALLNRNVPVSQVLNDIENMLYSPSHSSIISLLKSQDPLFSGFTIGHCIMGMFHISFALRNKFLFHQLVFLAFLLKMVRSSSSILINLMHVMYNWIINDTCVSCIEKILFECDEIPLPYGIAELDRTGNRPLTLVGGVQVSYKIYDHDEVMPDFEQKSLQKAPHSAIQARSKYATIIY